MNGGGAHRRTGMIAALVIVASAVGWVAGLGIAKAMGFEGAALIVVDLAALAGFLFALRLIHRCWRVRIEERD